MLEDTNLNQDVETNSEDLPENFFGDDDTLDVTPTEEETSEETETTEETPTEEVKEEAEETDKEVSSEETPNEVQTPFLKIRYNKEDKDLSQEEAITYAQKGMNYDHLNEKYTMLNNSISELARANGLSVDEYINNLKNVQENFELNKEIETLSKEYPNTNKELLKEVALNRLNEKRATITKEVENAETTKKAEIERQVEVFEKRYPNVDPSKLEKGVYDLMREGYTLLESYESVQADKRLAEDKKRAEMEKIQAQNNLNKQKSYGNTNNVGEIEDDDFIKSFMSED